MTAPASTAGLTRLRALTWWTMVACLLVVAGLLAGELVGLRSAATRLVATAAVLLVCVVAGRLFGTATRGWSPPSTPTLTMLVVTAAPAAAGIVALSRATGSGPFPSALPAAALLAAVWAGGWSWRAAGVTGAALTLGASLCGSWWAGSPSFRGALEDTGVTALCAAGLYAQIWVLGIADRLDRARQQEGAAAVAEERLRFAAELHDIQGHSLQVIALKSELAERLSRADPVRAAAEMREVQDLARQALGDTREVVRGYRAVSLTTEITNATRVLDAAGITATTARDDGLPDLPPAVENLLGLAVRECTTNVLRHSAATRCDVSLTTEAGTVLLRFTNDGPLEPSGPAGGLAGLRARIEAAGGRLDVHGTPAEFTVSACLPVPVHR